MRIFMYLRLLVLGLRGRLVAVTDMDCMHAAVCQQSLAWLGDARDPYRSGIARIQVAVLPLN